MCRALLSLRLCLVSDRARDRSTNCLLDLQFYLVNYICSTTGCETGCETGLETDHRNLQFFGVDQEDDRIGHQHKVSLPVLFFPELEDFFFFLGGEASILLPLSLSLVLWPSESLPMADHFIFCLAVHAPVT